MKLVSAFIGLAALGGVVLSSSTASAQASTVVVPAGYVCNEWGHCWHRHHDGYGYGYRFYHPHAWGGWGWHRHYWHQHDWHHEWRHWHRWHDWNTGD